MTMPLATYKFTDAILDELFDEQTDNTLQRKIEALRAREVPAHEKMLVTYLAAARMDEYLKVRGLSTTEMAELDQFRKTTPWVDAMREFDSIRAVLSKQKDFITAPAKWKFASRDIMNLGNPYKELSLKFEWKKSVPAGMLLDLSKRGVRKEKVNPYPTSIVTDVNLFGAPSLLPGASLPKGVAVKDLPLSKATSKLAPVKEEGGVPPSTESNTPPITDNQKQVTYANAVSGPSRRVQIRIAVNKLKEQPGVVTFDALKAVVEPLKPLSGREWLDLAQAKFGYRDPIIDQVGEYVSGVEHDKTL
jgi:hypothetical protein